MLEKVKQSLWFQLNVVKPWKPSITTIIIGSTSIKILQALLTRAGKIII